MALVLGAFLEGGPDVESILTTVWSSKLTIDEYRTSGILAAWRIGIGRDDAVGEGFNRSAFVACEEKPRTDRRGGRGTAGVRCPWKMVEDDRRASTRRPESEIGRSSQ